MKLIMEKIKKHRPTGKRYMQYDNSIPDEIDHGKD